MENATSTPSVVSPGNTTAVPVSPSSAPLPAIMPTVLPVFQETKVTHVTKTSWSSVISIVFIVLVIVIAALYFWGERIAKQGV